MIAKAEIYLSVVKPEEANGEAFNITDTATPGPWSMKWPILTEYFGLKGTGQGDKAGKTSTSGGTCTRKTAEECVRNMDSGGGDPRVHTARSQPGAEPGQDPETRLHRQTTRWPGPLYLIRSHGGGQVYPAETCHDKGSVRIVAIVVAPGLNIAGWF